MVAAADETRSPHCFDHDRTHFALYRPIAETFGQRSRCRVRRFAKPTWVARLDLGRAITCCISRALPRRRWTSSPAASGQLIVILSDINMPGMDGLTLLQEIKPRRPDLPVIIVTAYRDDQRRRRASEYGAVDFNTKPVDFNSLNAQLHRLALPTAREDG